MVRVAAVFVLAFLSLMASYAIVTALPDPVTAGIKSPAIAP